MHVLKYLLSVHYQAHGTVYSAIKVDDERMLYFLHTESHYSLPADASHCAARLDSLSCLQYLLQRNYPLTMLLYLEAARSCGTKCLAYLHQQGCPRNVVSCLTVAVKCKKWQSLEFLLSQEQYNTKKKQYERNIVPQIKSCVQRGVAATACADKVELPRHHDSSESTGIAQRLRQSCLGPAAQLRQVCRTMRRSGLSRSSRVPTISTRSRLPLGRYSVHLGH